MLLEFESVAGEEVGATSCHTRIIPDPKARSPCELHGPFLILRPYRLASLQGSMSLGGWSVGGLMGSRWPVFTCCNLSPVMLDGPGVASLLVRCCPFMLDGSSGFAVAGVSS